MPEQVSAPYPSVNWATDIVLKASDDIEYKVNRAAMCKMSRLVEGMVEGRPEAVLPILEVNGNTLKYVLEYVEYHHDKKTEPIEKPLRGKIETVVGEWDKTFLFTDLVKGGNESQNELLIEVGKAANYLQIQELRDLICATIASLIMDKTPEQIRALFRLENDYTPEQEAKVREENKWCLEE